MRQERRSFLGLYAPIELVDRFVSTIDLPGQIGMGLGEAFRLSLRSTCSDLGSCHLDRIEFARLWLNGLAIAVAVYVLSVGTLPHVWSVVSGTRTIAGIV